MIVALVLAGCTSLDQDPVRWMEGFRFSWDLFNHRLAHLELRPEDDALHAAVIGGTSTTGAVPPPPPDSCSVESCVEFPFTDLALLDVDWVRAESDETALVVGSADLLLESGKEATATVSATLPRGANGRPTAILHGLRLSTDHPLSGEPSCYEPSLGWHPQRFAIVLGEATETSDGVEVGVTAAFTPGASEDPARACIDEVVDRAVTGLHVDVLFVLLKNAPVLHHLHAEASYAFSGNSLDPGEQPEVAAEPYASGVSSSVVGWSAIDFRFDPGEDRGAYLRTLAVEATTTEALAWASNYSPGTQLEDFAYEFDGLVVGFEVDGAMERGTTTAVLVPDLDEGGDPVVQQVGWGSVRP